MKAHRDSPVSLTVLAHRRVRKRRAIARRAHAYRLLRVGTARNKY
jgi:hypothetical protein